MASAVPEKKVVSEFCLTTPDGHRLHVESHGNPRAQQSLLYFHGGWGPLTSDLGFVPSEYRTVYFHQRGWGKSQPQGSLSNNTFKDIVEDAERIRAFLGITRWVVFGGSTGAALALQYAADFPDSVAGVVLRGYWALTPEHLAWNYFGPGKRTIYPAEWARLCARVGCDAGSDGRDLLPRVYEALRRSDASSDAIAAAWLGWDALGSAITPATAPKGEGSTPEEWHGRNPRLAALLGLHFYNQTNAAPSTTALEAAGVRVVFIHGRLDLLCPPSFGAALADAAGGGWEVRVVELAMHSARDPGMAAALTEALEGFLPPALS